MTQAPINLTAPYEVVNKITNRVLHTVEDEELGHAILGITLSLGRLLAVGEMTKLNETEFVAAVLDYAGAYVSTMEGMTN